ncbi:MAG TPA: hypothetical protein VKF32_05895 [Thermoanaerobaculia bacterium]|nr:hypothetical protein [Thermoanaerobaculia bacterium]
MSCREVRERLVDPAAAGEAGAPAAAQHLEECEECRSASRAYGFLERIYRPERAGRAPENFDGRVLELVRRPRRRDFLPSALRGVPVPALAGGAAALVLVIALVAWPRKGPVSATARPRPARAAKAAPTRVVDAPPPAILAVGNAPISANAPQLGNAERARVSAMYDADFLLFEDALAALDAFYPEDLRVGPAAPGARAPEAAAARPPESADARELRMFAWRSMPAGERARLERLDAEHRKLGAERRTQLERRWIDVSWFPMEEKVGLRRIVSRFGELDPARAAQVVGQIRAIAAEPVERRGELWRALPFARSLTGQEQTAGERVLIAR